MVLLRQFEMLTERPIGFERIGNDQTEFSNAVFRRCRTLECATCRSITQVQKQHFMILYSIYTHG